MIVVKLMGGLGNQMFQYAAGRRLSNLRNTGLKLDLSFLNADTKGAYTKRDYALDVFSIKENFATEEEVISYRRLFQSRYRRFIYRKMPFLFSKAYITESGNKYHKNFINYPANTYLEGFWQSDKYFSGIENTIRNDFSFKDPPKGLNKELADKISNGRSVSLHVRRGDYIINESVKSYHGVCPPSYYMAGLERIKQKEKDPELFIFSDDAEWCRQNLVFDHPTTYIDHNKGEKSFEDMRLMSLCKHNIIANSSFSWWGAWLNKNPDKIVIAPKEWFADPANRSEDIYPKNWLRS